MKKVISCEKAIEMIPDGASLLIGGFMGVGSPHRLIDELVRQSRKRLTVIANDTGRPGFGVGRLIDAKLVSKLMATHIGLNPETQKQLINGDIEVELCPQGTLAERIRSGGFGLGGVLTPTGVGTVVEDHKQKLEVDGRIYLLEKPVTADFALLAAHRSDYLGNLEYSLTARNFNVVMATAGKTVIAEADHIVPSGVIPPDAVATPFVCINYIIGRGQNGQ
ncbi:MAG TPA: 3-oxoacid CoA-transferase subunit A [Terriglobales bacterium]|nr:3-oxoacid CoA-transferase subunit A [Terriglobales bacterium]